MKYKVTLQGRIYEVVVEQGEAMVVDEYEAYAPASAAPAIAAPVPQASSASVQTSAVATGIPVKAPLPGNVLSMNVKAGEHVKAGQILLIIEAMKMENEIIAPMDGVVNQILVSKGAAVATGDILITM